MVEKWDPVLGRRDPRDSQDLGTSSTSGSHEPPQDLRTLWKLTPPYEIQNLNTQKL